MSKTLLERFVEKILVTSGCWEWIDYKNEKGYGRFLVCGKLVRAHRFSYEIHRGFIPEGMTIDHLCRNKACVNPWHMEVVTAQENARRTVRLLKTHCKHGHVMGNYRDRKGRRVCYGCIHSRRSERRRWAAESQLEAGI